MRRFQISSNLLDSDLPRKTRTYECKVTEIPMIISPPTMMTLFFSKDPTSIFRGLNTISPLKVFVDPYFYLCGDLVTTEINCEVTHTF